MPQDWAPSQHYASVGETSALVYCDAKERKVASLHLLDLALFLGLYSRVFGRRMMSSTLYPEMYADLLGIGGGNTKSPIRFAVCKPTTGYG